MVAGRSIPTRIFGRSVNALVVSRFERLFSNTFGPSDSSRFSFIEYASNEKIIKIMMGQLNKDVSTVSISAQMEL